MYQISFDTTWYQIVLIFTVKYYVKALLSSDTMSILADLVLSDDTMSKLADFVHSDDTLSKVCQDWRTLCTVMTHFQKYVKTGGLCAQ